MNEPRVVESVTNECRSLGRAHESSSARAEQLISCLEGEIAKRDEELAACRVAVENCELFRARIVELEGSLLDANARLNGPPVSEAKAQGMVMPDRKYGNSTIQGLHERRGWNACIDEVARLNAAPAAPAADARLVDALEEIARSETAVGDIARSALAAHRSTGVV